MPISIPDRGIYNSLPLIKSNSDDRVWWGRPQSQTFACSELPPQWALGEKIARHNLRTSILVQRMPCLLYQLRLTVSRQSIPWRKACDAVSIEPQCQIGVIRLLTCMKD